MQGVEHALGRLDGVAHVTVDLQGGKATILPAAGARIEPEAVFEALRHAGFRPEAVTVEATGEVRRPNGKAMLFLPGQPEAWLELPDPAPADGAAKVNLRVTPRGEKR